MAKGKHAAALFEVIHSGKDRPGKSDALQTPKWWFKNRPKPEQPALPTTAADEDSSTDPIAPGRHRFDHLSRQVTFRFTYSSAAIGAGAVVLIVGLAFVIGRHLNRGPTQALAGSIDQLRQGPVNRGALNVGPGTANTSAGKPAPQSSPVDAFEGGSGARKAPPPASGAGQQPATPAISGKRVVGMQYVVVQSYPKESDAIAAADILGKNGVPCTIEKGLRGFHADWFTVAGTTGFERTRDNPDYTRYLTTINSVSKEFAAKIKFRQFEPMLVTWKDASR